MDGHSLSKRPDRRGLHVLPAGIVITSFIAALCMMVVAAYQMRHPQAARCRLIQVLRNRRHRRAYRPWAYPSRFTPGRAQLRATPLSPPACRAATSSGSALDHADSGQSRGCTAWRRSVVGAIGVTVPFACTAMRSHRACGRDSQPPIVRRPATAMAVICHLSSAYERNWHLLLLPADFHAYRGSVASRGQ
jgi:hypothetical protein